MARLPQTAAGHSLCRSAVARACNSLEPRASADWGQLDLGTDSRRAHYVDRLRDASGRATPDGRLPGSAPPESARRCDRWLDRGQLEGSRGLVGSDPLPQGRRPYPGGSDARPVLLGVHPRQTRDYLARPNLSELPVGEVAALPETQGATLARIRGAHTCTIRPSRASRPHCASFLPLPRPLLALFTDSRRRWDRERQRRAISIRHCDSGS